MEIDVEPVNSRIVEAWENHVEFLQSNRPEDESPWPRWPALYDNIVENPEVLYVGLNPSFYASQMGRRIVESTYDLDMDDLRWTGFEKEVAEFLKWERTYAKENYAYFKPMRSFADENGLNWDHIDVFVTRVTSQNKLDESLGLEAYAMGEKQNAFLEKQVDLFFDLLHKISPKVIVVENAFARDFLKQTRLKGEKYNLTPEDGVDPNKGFQTIDLGGQVPIFFTGMLSGRRALDIGSRQRLEWHILQALKGV